MFRSTHLIGELERAILAARGREIAGLLLESSDGEQRIRRAPNLLSDPGETELPRWWLDRALASGLTGELRPIAFFHSHTTSLDLSEADRASMVGFPLPWIVLLLREGRLTWAVYSPASG